MTTKIRCVLSGNKYHVDLVRNLIGNLEIIELIESEFFSKNVDVFYHILGFPLSLLREKAFWTNNRPIVLVHWIGSDVMTLVKPKSPTEKVMQLAVKLVSKMKCYKIIHLAGAPWLVEELKTKGINAIYLPLSTLDIKKLESQSPRINNNKDIDFLSYVPLRRFSFYGGHYILKLAKNLPSYKFTVVIPDINDQENLPKSPYQNLVFHQKVTFEEMQGLYKRSKCFLRLTEHDGLSLSVLEALFHRLQVIWTYSFPYTVFIKLGSIDEMIRVLVRVCENYSPNYDGYNYVLRNFSLDNIKKHYKNFFNYLANSLIP